ncbi:MAG TPA: S8 family serine peptidase [Steroidobacteraceae bacterium]|nr:S8 family serine peptidase [Steroidobacteraceae bacterium]
MRALICLLIASVAANSAQAQLRLPVAPLPPLPVQKLTQTVGQTGAAALDQLSEVRHLQIVRLIRANPRAIETDPRGNPVVRDELLAISPTVQAIDAAQARGFRIVREQTIGDLDLHLVVLQPPARMSTAKALRQLREADPAGTYDFNHIYMGVGAAAARLAESPRPESAQAAGAEQSVPRVGLVDSGIDASHPVFQGAVIHTWGCGEHPFASTHGTAVASLLVGQSAAFHGVLDRAELYAADVYCNAPTGGAVDALAAAFAWLAQQRVAVINVSLVGPDNAALAQIVRTLTSRGYLLVAAVGNDGPAAAPLYPASYPHVVGVTAVDSHRRVLIEAARGNQVMFAARGADMSAADMAGKYSAIRGTSFAAPIVAALLAQSLSVPDPSASNAAVESLAHSAIDLGPPGRDLTYGFGLVGGDYRTDLALPSR